MMRRSPQRAEQLRAERQAAQDAADAEFKAAKLHSTKPETVDYEVPIETKAEIVRRMRAKKA